MIYMQMNSDYRMTKKIFTVALSALIAVPFFGMIAFTHASEVTGTLSSNGIVTGSQSDGTINGTVTGGQSGSQGGGGGGGGGGSGGSGGGSSGTTTTSTTNSSLGGNTVSSNGNDSSLVGTIGAGTRRTRTPIANASTGETATGTGDTNGGSGDQIAQTIPDLTQPETAQAASGIPLAAQAGGALPIGTKLAWALFIILLGMLAYWGYQTYQRRRGY